ncbi:type II toxin-antitoxin system RelE/ParE family toxin [Aestuariibacter sp. A3R04]|uniref:type II toxin-antitoxin system RelE/ParE family toxin n=1 Tax=Aestuariibacter sp. A3R04 TaxID=2841571 RepID=UPI0020910930|nr:type II toxin-antitoxin system RelE/ParE family toxin [Aestuariibacter sp. A3R04]
MHNNSINTLTAFAGKWTLRLQLAAIHTAQDIDDINLPGFSLHQLKGERSNIWTILVNGNRRVTFEFTDGHAYILNYEDYH